MSVTDIAYLPETPAHDHAIEQINQEAFGPGRFTRAAYKIREGGPHERDLSFVAVHWGKVIGSVRMTRIAAGEGRALLLGPLAVIPDWKNLGIGRKLVALAIEKAREADHELVVLVGDAPYYSQLGFKRMPYGQINMPRPVDRDRLQAIELVSGAQDKLRGNVVHEDQVGGMLPPT